MGSIMEIVGLITAIVGLLTAVVVLILKLLRKNSKISDDKPFNVEISEQKNEFTITGGNPKINITKDGDINT